MAVPIITLLTIFIALAGGVQFYRRPQLGTIFVLLALAAVLRAGYLWYKDRPQRPDILPHLALLLAPMIISTLFNGVSMVAINRITFFIVALVVVVLAWSHHPTELQAGLWWAGVIWPVVWLFACKQDNFNILAVWSVVFCLIGLRSGVAWYAAIHLVILVILGSRGAFLGLAGGVWVLYHQNVTRRPVTLAVLVLALAGLLVMVRPTTAIYRLFYWQYAMAAWLQSIWFGVGPGGINTLHLIPEPGGGYQIHAHNIFVTYLTETGLVGLVALLASVGWFYVSRFTFSQWQLAVVTALVLHSLVDDPLWWPGPLILAAAVAGARRNAWTFIPPGWKISRPETNTI